MATVTNIYTTSFSSSLAGYVARAGSSETFSVIRAGAGTDSGTAQMSVYLGASSTTNQFNTLQRGIALFNTSSIPTGATIVSAFITVGGSGVKLSQLGSFSIVVVSSSPASNSVLANSDYANVGSTSFGSISDSSFQANNQNAISLNSSGLSNITKNGISKFGFRTDWDQTGTFGGVWGSGLGSTATWSTALLTVTYTVDFPTLSMNNVSSLSNITTITTS